ncbi:EamA family transporter [Limnohabitans sp. Rim8]|jgi:drug/metabolite transporter (DMT)-like permease|uniref:DMT family transporter n=1 Tax=Limnohabitans sp. Rim8 TaxID=1100718 RepID=UPI0025D6529C|nr:EamA family transporter [Limnohabitans sp. Rim8]
MQLMTLSRQQITLLITLTLVWGFNWPMLKLGVNHYPPLSFRSLSMWMGLPFLALLLYVKKVPFKIPKADWKELFILTVTNMLVWHVLIMLAVQSLSSGRSAILGYTMPIFSAMIGVLGFGAVLRWRGWLGVGCAAFGVVLLLWHELSAITGKPLGVVLGLVAAAFWGLGTQQIRHTRIQAPTLALVFWMTCMSSVLMSVLAFVFERDIWGPPPDMAWVAIVYNAFGVFVFAQAAWLSLARNLPPLASTLSVMFIPVLGVFSGAYFLNEDLHWQDWAAIVLIVLAIASVLWPESRPPAPARQAAADA